MKRGKKYQDALKKYDKLTPLATADAVKLAQELSFAKFDETLELSIKLKLGRGKSVRDTLVLPHQFGAQKRILVFAKGDKAQEALDAGAAFVGDDDLVEKIRGGWLDFDIAVATPDMMQSVGRLGPILGRRGLMPNPKTQTVTFDIKAALEELQKGRVEFRSDKTGVIHLSVGKVSMDAEKIADNIDAIVTEVKKRRPADTKGDFVLSVSLSSTMGPGIRVAEVQAR